MANLAVNGVPNSVRMDGWWLGGGNKSAAKDNKDGAREGPIKSSRAAALLALIVLSDILLWQVNPGVSLAVFGPSVLSLGWAVAGRQGEGGIAAAAVFFLPVIERVTTLSLVFWFVGMAVGAAWIALGGWRNVGVHAAGARRFVARAPAQVFGDFLSLVRRFSGKSDSHFVASILQGWAIPLGVGLVFVALLIEANPMLDGWLSHLLAFDGINFDRLIFWAGIAFIIWPFLAPPTIDEKPSGAHASKTPRSYPSVFNEAAVRRSLILFNVLFALQTALDATFLWGGAALPEGMTYAQYAHRGAYPLILTALLAGGFAVLAHPFVRGNKFMRMLLLFWVAQTVWMVISSLYRLELYVGVYGLTRLRLAALIWMGTVALGLLLVIWQVHRQHNAGWLSGRASILGAGVLYVCCFISFDGHVARYNLSNNVKADVYYICNLGSDALPAIAAQEQLRGVKVCPYGKPKLREIRDWREWGFRDWRVQRSLVKMQPETHQYGRQAGDRIDG